MANALPAINRVNSDVNSSSNRCFNVSGPSGGPVKASRLDGRQQFVNAKLGRDAAQVSSKSVAGRDPATTGDSVRPERPWVPTIRLPHQPARPPSLPRPHSPLFPLSQAVNSMPSNRAISFFFSSDRVVLHRRPPHVLPRHQGVFFFSVF